MTAVGRAGMAVQGEMEFIGHHMVQYLLIRQILGLRMRTYCRRRVLQVLRQEHYHTFFFNNHLTNHRILTLAMNGITL